MEEKIFMSKFKSNLFKTTFRLSLVIAILFQSMIILSKFSTPAEAAVNPGFKMPWINTEEYYFTGGAHQWGSDPHRSGLDFAPAAGSQKKALAVANGTVLWFGNQGSTNGGNVMKISHANGWETWYVHLASFESGIAVGNPVSAGQVLGTVGNTGTISEHLHIELLKNGSRYDWNNVIIDDWKVYTNCSASNAPANCQSTNYNGYIENVDTGVQKIPLASPGTNQLVPSTNFLGSAPESVDSRPKISMKEVGGDLVQSTTDADGYVRTRVINENGIIGSWETSTTLKTTVAPTLESVAYDDNGITKYKLLQSFISNTVKSGTEKYLYTRIYDEYAGTWTSWSHDNIGTITSPSLEAFNSRIYQTWVDGTGEIYLRSINPINNVWSNTTGADYGLSDTGYDAISAVSMESTSSFMILSVQTSQLSGSGYPTSYVRVLRLNGTVEDWDTAGVSIYQPTLHGFNGSIYQLTVWGSGQVAHRKFNGTSWVEIGGLTKADSNPLYAANQPQMGSAGGVLVQAVRSSESDNVYVRELDTNISSSWTDWSVSTTSTVNVAVKGFEYEDKIFLSAINSYDMIRTNVYSNGAWQGITDNGKGTSMVSMEEMQNRLYQAVTGPFQVNGDDQVLIRSYSTTYGGWSEKTTDAITTNSLSYIDTPDKFFQAYVDQSDYVIVRIYNKSSGTWTTESSTKTAKNEPVFAMIPYTNSQGQPHYKVVLAVRSMSNDPSSGQSYMHTRIYSSESGWGTWEQTSSTKKNLSMHTFNGRVYQTWVRNDDKVMMRVLEQSGSNPSNFVWTSAAAQSKNSLHPVSMASTSSYMIQAVRSTEDNSTQTGQKIYWRKLNTSNTWTTWSDTGTGDTIQAINLEEFNGDIYLAHVTPNDNARIREFGGSSWIIVNTSSAVANMPIFMESNDDALVISFKGTNNDVYTTEYDCTNTCSWSSWELKGKHMGTDVSLQNFKGRIYQALAFDDTTARIRYYTPGSGWSHYNYINRTTDDIVMSASNERLYFSSLSATAAPGGGNYIQSITRSITPGGGAGWSDWETEDYTSL